MKRIFTTLVIGSAAVYVFLLYYMLFGMPSREMVILSEHMLERYNHWNSVNLIPFKTIAEYMAAVVDGGVRGHAMRNLAGNLLLLFPAGFYLPFFLRAMRGFKRYGIATAAIILTVELAQSLTMTGSFDVDDFMLNFAGALLGFVVFTRTPARGLLELRAW